MATVLQERTGEALLDQVVLELHDLDVGQPMAEKSWRFVYAFLENVGSASPVLTWWTWRPDGALVSGTATGRHHGGGRWRFSLPRTAWGRYLNVRLVVGQSGDDRDVPEDFLVRPYLEVDYEVLREL